MRLTALYRYPVKSAQGETLQASAVEGLGLVGDRRWMLVDEASGRFHTQRNLLLLGRLSAQYSADGGLNLSAPGLPPLYVPVPAPDSDLRGVVIWKDALRVPDAGEAAARWVSELVGKPTRLVHVPDHRTRPLGAGDGEPEDRVAFADGFPLLLINQASVDDLSRRVGRPMAMLRFRPNLVVEGFEAYAEDGWKRLRIGDVTFRVAKPCARCVLTTIDPATHERDSDREPLNTLKGYRLQEGGIMFGQNVISEGRGVLELGMAVIPLE
ncbi:MOSC domain-containing protein [Pseudomonas sp. RIT-PI-S]|uniref:MOSC domain-containing protein n=1 Tax=Pseudomonas sp. RIT-PI-S TaxID=3035295 RepID=UPI0021D85C25|nr:MOSC domain-containing protein [Pseudomonas sp. RIT-PI-S]